MEKGDILEHQGKGSHSTAALKKVDMSTFYAAVPCLPSPYSYAVSPFLYCCAMSNFSTLLHCIYFFNAAAICLLFLHCCTMSTFSRLLRHVYFFHAATLCLLIYVYSYHRAAAFYLIKGAALYLLFPCCYAMKTFFLRCFAMTTF